MPNSSYDSVLIEQIHSKMDIVIEGMSTLRSALIERMDAKFAAQDARFDVIEAVLQQHNERFTCIEDRLDRMECKLDQVSACVERHDTLLKTPPVH